MVQFVFVEGKETYFNILIELGQESVNRIQKLFADEFEHRELLDKLNLLRILELLMHTILTTGHSKHTSDFLLERKHQPLKRFYERNRRVSNMYTLYSDAADGWKSDIWRIYNALSSPDLHPNEEDILFTELRESY